MRRKRAEARTQGISIPCLCRRAEGLAQVPRRNESQGEVFQKEYGKRQLPEESIQMLQKWDGSEMGGGGGDRICWIPRRYSLAADGLMNMKDLERLKILDRHAVV